MPTSPRGSATPQRRVSDRLIVALDVPTLGEATRLVDELAPHVGWFKIGSELFTAAGPHAVELVLDRERHVFLDLKFHDIPRTVAAAVASGMRLGVGMMDIHVVAGDEALRAAVRSLAVAFPETSGASETPRAHRYVPRGRPQLLGVTRLTSLDEETDTLAQVVESAARAKWCGLDGVIASPREAAAIKTACGSGFLVVTPGIRPTGSAEGDQRRTATPGDAVRAGADYLVVGRPVLQAPDPVSMVALLLKEMDAALHQETPAPVRNP